MGSTLTVLIVDDETIIRQILKRTITRYDFNTIEASNGAEALSILSDKRCDIVITDIKMPEMDGITLLKEIRARFGAIPVVFITGYGSEFTASEIIDSGADYFITKPFKNVEISRTLKIIAAKLASQTTD